MPLSLIFAAMTPVRWLLTAIAVALLSGAVIYGPGFFKGGKHAKPKAPTKVSLIPTTPPPPPKEEKKIEPPKNEAKEIKMNTPQTPAPVAQNEPIKMEGAAGSGDSPFGGGTVSREGVMGGMGSTLYGTQLQKHLQLELNRNRKLKESDYRIRLNVWIGRDGAIQRAELVGSTGSEAVDLLLKQSLLNMAAMPSAPPDNIPQPMRIQVTARGAS